MNENEQPINLEVLQPSAIEALERASVDVQVSTAHKYPRSLEKFKKRALDMATIDTETADSCIYLRPVGKKDGKMQYAEGASIRMAEIVAASYGNIRVASRIIEQTPRFVKCEGVAHDLETNYAGKSESVEVTVTREGQPFSEGMRAVVAKACLAKAYRDAVFKVVPRALCKTVYDAANKIADGKDKPLKDRVEKVQAWLSTIKVDDARVFAALGVNGWSEIGHEHLRTLTGIKTCLADGDTKIEEAFPPVVVEKKPEATGVGQSQGKKPTETKKPDEKKPEPAKDKPTEASGAQTPPQQPSQPANAAPASSSEQGQANKKLDDSGDVAGEAPKEALGKVETLGDPPANPPAEEPLPPFQRKQGDSDEMANIKFLCHQNRITEPQFMNWARKEKVAKENQTAIGDMASTKLLNLSKAWQNNPKEFAEKIRAANA